MRYGTAFLSFWGKAQPRVEAAVSWHPVAYHLLDVAASAKLILKARPLVCARLEKLLQLTPDEVRSLVAALAALHDLGKFAPAFQSKATPAGWMWPIGLEDPEVAANRGTFHTEDGYALWRDAIGELVTPIIWPTGRETLNQLAPAIFGHHGIPVKTGFQTAPSTLLFGDAALQFAKRCAEAVLGALDLVSLNAQPPSDRSARIASWLLSGCITVADWIGSTQRWFPYTAPDYDDSDLRRYWECAQDRAARAIDESGVAQARAATVRTFVQLTGFEQPSPAQEWACNTVLPEGPLLIILEDVTGSGKTEAAQVLANRLMADGRAGGVYWAMPTQATANAMYTRQARHMRALFEAGAEPSLVLTHGQSWIREHYRTSLLNAITEEPEAKSAGGMSDGEVPAGSLCAAFLADDRRAALLADVGAGTVDQALLGVLPSKHNGVRLFGLSDKLIVVDEAHAYDSYVSTELRELLRFHAAFGGCAIVLSATLTRAQREGLLLAWLEGLQGGRRLQTTVPKVDAAETETYPCATIVSGATERVQITPLASAPEARRAVGVRMTDSIDEVLEMLRRAQASGAASVWIRNTVDDCLRAAEALREIGLTPLVFHARFAHCDRQAREAQVLRAFGKDAPSSERRGAMLVATQVVEQSLDLDFDVMVSDLAPIDLLVQRAGRLQRHRQRDTDRPRGTLCELVVYGPSYVEEPHAGWVTDLLPGTARIYSDAGVLWRTARALVGIGVIEAPGGIRRLIEAVYENDNTPAPLREATDEARAQAQAHASIANYTTLKVGDGYSGNAQSWHNDLRPLTRLGDPQTVVRLARTAPDGRLIPWAEGIRSERVAWALSEIRLSSRRVPFGSKAAEHTAAVAQLQSTWTRYEREMTVLPVSSADEISWTGVLLSPSGRTIAVTYTIADGLRYPPM